MLTFAADLPQVLSLVVEDLDAVSPIVRYEDFLSVVDDDPVGELQVLGAPELVEDVAHLVEDDDAHHLALNHDDAALVVHAHAPVKTKQNCFKLRPLDVASRLLIALMQDISLHKQSK